MAKEKGGDLLGFDDDIDRIIFELDYSYVFEDLDSDTVDGAMVQAYSGLQTRVNGVSDRHSFQPRTAYRVAMSQKTPREGTFQAFYRSVSTEEFEYPCSFGESFSTLAT